jgi:hypothetical protein
MASNLRTAKATSTPWSTKEVSAYTRATPPRLTVNCSMSKGGGAGNLATERQPRGDVGRIDMVRDGALRTDVDCEQYKQPHTSAAEGEAEEEGRNTFWWKARS